MRTVFILMDSLNRHMLKMYNSKAWTLTPNIDRLARRSMVFNNHWLGSAPCMPARRDIMTGRFSFLERPWGPIEPFDVTLPGMLRQNGIYTHIITDHHHYFELGGEGYCQAFNTWNFIRGQEYDRYGAQVQAPDVPEEYYGKVSAQYESNRQKFINNEAEYPTPKTFSEAASWLEQNHQADDFFLWVEAFSPHEPFDCPEKYLQMFDDNYSGPHYNWSGYAPVNEPDEATEHLRKQYAGTLAMADCWLGKLLDVMDIHDMWKDTLVILTTDHGHLLGEHGFTGKNYMHVYNELAHIPLFIHQPGGCGAGKRIDAITQNIDIMPTILDYYGATIPNHIHGHSLRQLLDETLDKVRDAALYGWFGHTVNIYDGRYTYFRAPARKDNQPCFMYCGLPVTLNNYLGVKQKGNISYGSFLKYTDYPVLKIPRSMKQNQYIDRSLLFDIQNDYSQEHSINDLKIEKEMLSKLSKLMSEMDAPEEQYERLGIC